MSCCNNSKYISSINPSITLEKDKSSCYVSRFTTPKTKIGKRVSKKEKTCCTEIDLDKIKRRYSWSAGDCIDGVLTYNEISINSKEKSYSVQIPLDISIQGILRLVPNMTTKEASDLLEARVVVNTEGCLTEYCNEEITEIVKANCPVGYTSNSETIVIQECQFKSTLSVEDANLQAQIYINNIKADFIENNINCSEIPTYCNEFVTGSIPKPNCYTKTPLLVFSSISAGTLCGYYTQESANQAAEISLASKLQIEALNADPEIYCLDTDSPIDPVDPIDPIDPCGTDAFVGNIRNNNSAKILDYTTTWTQIKDNIYENFPVVQTIKGGERSILPSQNNRYSLQLFRNGIKIIDSGSLIDDKYFTLSYDASIRDEFRYVATFEFSSGADYIFEATQTKGCGIPAENLVTKSYVEGDGI